MKACAADAFWKFSLALYARSGVAERLVEFQDEHGADVNMILFCCWCGKEGRMPLGDVFFQEADRHLDEWRYEVVETLRGVRRRLKGGMVGVPNRLTNSLRDEVKRLEVEAERISQSVIASLAPTGSQAAGEPAIRAALNAYIKHADIIVNDRDRGLLDRLVAESLAMA